MYLIDTVENHHRRPLTPSKSRNPAPWLSRYAGEVVPRPAGGRWVTICTSRQVDGGVRAGRCIQSPVWVMRARGRAVGVERWRRTCVPTPPPPLSRRQNLRLYSKHLRTSDTGQVADSYSLTAAQASFSRHIYGVEKRQEPSNDGCRPCDGSAAASTRRAHARRARQA
jgi:hypothetical protein